MDRWNTKTARTRLPSAGPAEQFDGGFALISANSFSKLREQRERRRTRSGERSSGAAVTSEVTV